MKPLSQHEEDVMKARESNSHAIKYSELAKADFEMVLQIDPGHREAAERLKNIVAKLKDLYEMRDAIDEMEALIKRHKLKLIGGGNDL